MKDIVSIITPFYNVENYILQCINSVNNQIIDDSFSIEYILINDGSTDASSDIIDLYFNKYNNDNINVKVINLDTNNGPGYARNIGIEYSSGNYIMFLDGDDYYIKNDFVLRAHDIITSNNADIVEFGFKFFNEYGSFEYVYPTKNQMIENNKETNIYAMFYDNVIKFMPWTKILRRNIVESKKFDLNRIFEDIRTVTYWVYNSYRIVLINSIEINYRNKNNSIIRNNIEETKYGTVLAISDLFEDFKDNKLILKAFYNRAMVDLKSIINLDSNSEYFRKMSKLNTKMLSYLYPDEYKDITYDVENDNNK